MTRKLPFTVSAIVGVLVGAAASYAQAPAAKVYQAAGPNPASIESTVNQFRAAFGGINNGNNAGPLAGGRREINWDGAGGTSTATSPGPTPFDVFLAGRGTRFTTPGTGFVQAPAAGLADLFLNPDYSGIFQPFSNARLFSAIGSNVTDVYFFVPGGGEIPATTRGFGVVLTDVDLPNGSGPGDKRGNRKSSTLIKYFDVFGNILFSSFAPASPGDAGLSFFGIILDDPRIARVQILSGDAALGVNDDDKNDIAVMDDVVYGEPQPVQ